MSDYGPSLQAARLYRKQSAKGATYFVGRWGMLKIALLKSKETADDGSEIWNLLVSQAPAPKQQADRQDASQQRRVVRDPQAPLDRDFSNDIPL